jgi:hypothetical protein
MSFGLLTALNVEDVPNILRRVAHGYRGTETDHDKDVWLYVANELDRFADELEPRIKRAKHKRIRL